MPLSELFAWAASPMAVGAIAAIGVDGAVLSRASGASQLDDKPAGDPVAGEPAGSATGDARPQPRPTYGIFVAMIVMVSTLASSGRLAI